MKLARLILIFSLNICVVFSRNFRHHENQICTNSTIRRVYLEFGQKSSILLNSKNYSSECIFELVTCPSCVISLNFSVTHDLYDSKAKYRARFCENATIEISEPPYQKSGHKICSNATKTSLTRAVTIKFGPVVQDGSEIVLKFQSVRNSLQFNGKIHEKGIITSPFFPSNYPNDLNMEYIITCDSPNCSIKMIFTDFLVSSDSIIEFFDHLGNRLDVATGSQFRPRPIITPGPVLVVRFYAGGGNSQGYKAFYTFHDAAENVTLPYTNCGGLVEDIGGAITMMDMVQGDNVVHYDCIWIIKPLTVYYKSHLFLEVADFTKMEMDTKLQIIQGTTSVGRILEIYKVRNDTDDIFIPREHTILISTGIYIRLKGIFNSESRIAISYAAFKYSKEKSDCYTPSDFVCTNRRCISRILSCDGLDHCGDNSDEFICQATDVPGVVVRPSWYLPPHAPNYIFPKYSGGYPDLRTATLVFALSSLGLVALVLVLFVLIYKINIKSRTRNIRSDSTRSLQIQIIADALVEEEIIDTESIPDEPPTYEAPPIYEDCMKNLENTPKKVVKKIEIEDIGDSTSSLVVKKGTKRNRKNKKSTNRRKIRRTNLDTPDSPPPKYEAEDSRIKYRRRSRSQGEIRSSTFSNINCFSDTASDSELMNMVDKGSYKFQKYYTS